MKTPEGTPQVTGIPGFHELHQELRKDIEALPGETQEFTAQYKDPGLKAQGKRFEETKRLIETFKEKVANYPKHMSYEGSMVLCVLLSMKTVAAVSMQNIPSVDQALIKSLVPAGTEVGSFDVKFDQNKDFVLIFNPQDNADLTVTLFNTVAHPRSEDLSTINEVRVETDEDRVAVGGGRIKVNKRTIRRLFGEGKSQDEQSSEKEEPQKRQQTAGKNAYEIRADVLQMAVDWGKHTNSTSHKDVISLAKEFYSFVENRR